MSYKQKKDCSDFQSKRWWKLDLPSQGQQNHPSCALPSQLQLLTPFLLMECEALCQSRLRPEHSSSELSNFPCIRKTGFFLTKLSKKGWISRPTESCTANHALQINLKAAGLKVMTKNQSHWIETLKQHGISLHLTARPSDSVECKNWIKASLVSPGFSWVFQWPQSGMKRHPRRSAHTWQWHTEFAKYYYSYLMSHDDIDIACKERTWSSFWLKQKIKDVTAISLCQWLLLYKRHITCKTRQVWKLKYSCDSYTANKAYLALSRSVFRKWNPLKSESLHIWRPFGSSVGCPSNSSTGSLASSKYLLENKLRFSPIEFTGKYFTIQTQ